jgi:hypothetical protein
MNELLTVIILFSMLIIGLLIIFGLFSSISRDRVTDYDLYGPDGPDEWERKQMGISTEEYEQYKIRCNPDKDL